MFSTLVVFIMLVVLGLIIYMYMLGYWGINYSVSIGNSLNTWFSSFECGFINHGCSENFFSFSYLSLLVLFVIFDLEVSLLLNVSFDGVWFNSYFCYLLFILLLVGGYIIEVLLGYVSWVS
uniref:NADH-ubiquinone oxidoreductase chain 3 n=1 Tax=Schistosoma turkestanicum TaxID=1163369 RepID=G4WCP6_9TREM|nr:NADH dehydrogenase subunit 3 [Schistosoma turkestanicum]